MIIRMYIHTTCKYFLSLLKVQCITKVSRRVGLVPISQIQCENFVKTCNLIKTVFNSDSSFKCDSNWEFNSKLNKNSKYDSNNGLISISMSKTFSKFNSHSNPNFNLKSNPMECYNQQRHVGHGNRF